MMVALDRELGKLFMRFGLHVAAIALLTEKTGHPCIVARLSVGISSTMCLKLRQWLLDNPVTVHLPRLHVVFILKDLSWDDVNLTKARTSRELLASEGLCMLAGEA
jgi:hypothetical protein